MASDTACLVIHASAHPETVWTPILLTAQETFLGRPEEGETRCFIDLDDRSVSRNHAIITCEDTGYTLTNWQGTYNIGLYETTLQKGQRHSLRHGDIFRIPDLASHFRIQFFLTERGTTALPLWFDTTAHQFRVFEELVPFTDLERAIITYLYTHHGELCTYEAITAAVWPSDASRNISKKKDIGVHLTNIRTKIERISGGFSFIKTIDGQGLKLLSM